MRIWHPHRGDAVGISLRFWHKTRVSGLLNGVVCVIVRLAVLVQCQFVTDRQTDGRTDRHMTIA